MYYLADRVLLTALTVTCVLGGTSLLFFCSATIRAHKERQARVTDREAERRRRLTEQFQVVSGSEDASHPDSKPPTHETAGPER